MQVIDVDGRRPPDPLWLDVVNVPADGSVTVRIRFADLGGRTVYHCHIPDHEDLGMVGTILAGYPHRSMGDRHHRKETNMYGIGGAGRSARDGILDQRYARGEIDEQDYQERRRRLNEPGG
jgi:hypothetical protein